MYLLQTEALSYQFRKAETILNNIHLQVPEGSIYGFLGPNETSKTTTLKLVLGLLRKQKGRSGSLAKILTLNAFPFCNKQELLLNLLLFICILQPGKTCCYINAFTNLIRAAFHMYWN